MAPPKGTSGNPNGRPKGTPNKATTEIRAAIKKIFEDNIPGLQEELGLMSPATKWKIIESLFKYSFPTFAQAKLEGDINHAISIKPEYSPLGSIHTVNHPNLVEDSIYLKYFLMTYLLFYLSK